MRLNDDGKTVAAVGLLVPTLARYWRQQREERHDVPDEPHPRNGAEGRLHGTLICGASARSSTRALASALSGW